MKTAEVKSNLHQIIDSINDNSLIIWVYSILSKLILKKDTADFWETLSPEEKASIEEGIAEADRGELIPHENVLNEIKAKYGI
jgi:predicted transcriptional regulator